MSLMKYLRNSYLGKAAVGALVAGALTVGYAKPLYSANLSNKIGAVAAEATGTKKVEYKKKEIIGGHESSRSMTTNNTNVAGQPVHTTVKTTVQKYDTGTLKLLSKGKYGVSSRVYKIIKDRHNEKDNDIKVKSGYTLGEMNQGVNKYRNPNVSYSGAQGLRDAELIAKEYGFDEDLIYPNDNFSIEKRNGKYVSIPSDKSRTDLQKRTNNAYDRLEKQANNGTLSKKDAKKLKELQALLKKERKVISDSLAERLTDLNGRLSDVYGDTNVDPKEVKSLEKRIIPGYVNLINDLVKAKDQRSVEADENKQKAISYLREGRNNIKLNAQNDKYLGIVDDCTVKNGEKQDLAKIKGELVGIISTYESMGLTNWANNAKNLQQKAKKLLDDMGEKDTYMVPGCDGNPIPTTPAVKKEDKKNDLVAKWFANRGSEIKTYLHEQSRTTAPGIKLDSNKIDGIDRTNLTHRYKENVLDAAANGVNAWVGVGRFAKNTVELPGDILNAVSFGIIPKYELVDNGEKGYDFDKKVDKPKGIWETITHPVTTTIGAAVEILNPAVDTTRGVALGAYNLTAQNIIDTVPGVLGDYGVATSDVINNTVIGTTDLLANGFPGSDASKRVLGSKMTDTKFDFSKGFSSGMGNLTQGMPVFKNLYTDEHAQEMIGENVEQNGAKMMKIKNTPTRKTLETLSTAFMSWWAYDKLLKGSDDSGTGGESGEPTHTTPVPAPVPTSPWIPGVN